MFLCNWVILKNIHFLNDSEWLETHFKHFITLESDNFTPTFLPFFLFFSYSYLMKNIWLSDRDLDSWLRFRIQRHLTISLGFQPSLSLKSILYLNYVNSALSTIFSSDIRFQNKKCLKRFEEEWLNFNFWKSTRPRQLFFTPNPNLVNPVFENSYSWRVCFWKELLSLRKRFNPFTE